jgi:hypothetical protein
MRHVVEFLVQYGILMSCFVAWTLCCVCDFSMWAEPAEERVTA